MGTLSGDQMLMAEGCMAPTSHASGEGQAGPRSPSYLQAGSGPQVRGRLVPGPCMVLSRSCGASLSLCQSPRCELCIYH